MAAGVHISLSELVGAYLVPSQALWRTVELSCLQETLASRRIEPPVLDVGCGDGAFGQLLFDTIELGVDLNPRAVERCRERRSYNEVQCVDITAGSLKTDHYATVLANSTLEHISDLGKALRSINKCLRPGGLFVAAVPLEGMNEHLLVGSERYRRFRQAQLHHEHLLSLEEWRDTLSQSGFEDVEYEYYLSPSTMRCWDALDLPMHAGVGRYTIGAGISALNRIELLARPLRHLATFLLNPLTPQSAERGGCAAVLTAHKR